MRFHPFFTVRRQ